MGAAAGFGAVARGRYYTRLDEGQSSNASDVIIEALARALDLDDDERVHLYELARPVPARRKRVMRAEMAVPGALALLASMPSVPTLLLGRRNDVLAWNPLGHALVAGPLAFTDPDDPATRPNQMWLLFLDPHTRELHRDWADEAASAVASLRFVAGQYPDNRALAELVGELSMNSREFARLWARHDVRLCSSGTKRLHHPQVATSTCTTRCCTSPTATASGCSRTRRRWGVLRRMRWRCSAERGQSRDRQGRMETVTSYGRHRLPAAAHER